MSPLSLNAPVAPGDKLGCERTHLTDPWDSWKPCGDTLNALVGGRRLYLEGGSLYQGGLNLQTPAHGLVYQLEKAGSFESPAAVSSPMAQFVQFYIYLAFHIQNQHSQIPCRLM